MSQQLSDAPKDDIRQTVANNAPNCVVKFEKVEKCTVELEEEQEEKQEEEKEEQQEEEQQEEEQEEE